MNLHNIANELSGKPTFKRFWNQNAGAWSCTLRYNGVRIHYYFNENQGREPPSANDVLIALLNKAISAHKNPKAHPYNRGLANKLKGMFGEDIIERAISVQVAPDNQVC